MDTKAGNIVWFEVVGRDANAMKAFYGELFGWQLTGMPGAPDYAISDAKQTGLPGGVGSSPGGGSWATFYVQVDDIHASVERVTGLGGKTIQPPMTMPDGDWISVVSDPEGHVVGLFQCA